MPDEAIEPLLEAFRCGKTYWHSLDGAELGLTYCGITLIPPETLDAYLEIIWKNPKRSELATLFTIAVQENCTVLELNTRK